MSLRSIFAPPALLAAGAWLAVFAMTATTHAEHPALNSGDRVVFLGDSITEAGAGPNGYVTIFRNELAKRHPELKVEVLGAGISGNKVPDLEGRLERDVLSKKPTVVVIYIGINDVWHSQTGNGTSKENFEAGLKRIIEKVTKAGARPVLCTASVIGEKTDGSNHHDKMLDEYCEVSRAVAAETKTQLIDLRKAFLAHLKQHNTKNVESNILTSDTVHLNEAGNKFVAAQMLTGLTGGEQQQAGAKSGSVLRHVVLFKFKDSASKEQVEEVVKAFGKLKDQVDTIKDFEWGTDNSPEMIAQGFTHCFIVTFADEKGRDAYLPHPQHEVFKKLVGPVLDKVLVVDFWTK